LPITIEPNFERFVSATVSSWDKIKVSGGLSGKWRLRGPIQGLRALACARVLPGQAAYLRLHNSRVIHGKEKVYGSIP